MTKDIGNALARLAARPAEAGAMAFAGLGPVVAVLAAPDFNSARVAVLATSLLGAGLVAAVLSMRAAASPSDAGERRKSHRRAADALVAQLDESAAARTHPVTGLSVREPFLAEVQRALLSDAAQPAMLGLIRLANFDQIVAFDPAAAERVLIALSQRLTGAVKADRPLAQVDRDCFAIWFDGAASAAAELDAIGYVLGQELDDGELTITPDIQLGSAQYPVDAEEAGNLLNRAFVSLARPQRTADGAIAFFARCPPAEAKRRFTVEQDLRRAIRRGELALHYQPFVDVAMGRVVGAEALLRWQTKTHAGLSPTQVISVLEEAGLAQDVGLWTLNSACRQLRVWREGGLEGVKVAVNVSARHLRDPGLVGAFERTVASHGLTPAQIELELTETAAMEDVQRTQAVFERLREMGFGLAIDDFGSGYSSLSNLRRLPFQKLKIDREFVTRVDERADSRTICRALIDLTAGLELSVLAEGVERFEEVELLRTLGCSTFQGFYFARPMPPEEFLATITSPEWLGRVCSRVHRERDELRRRLS